MSSVLDLLKDPLVVGILTFIGALGTIGALLAWTLRHMRRKALATETEANQSSTQVATTGNNSPGVAASGDAIVAGSGVAAGSIQDSEVTNLQPGATLVQNYTNVLTGGAQQVHVLATSALMLRSQGKLAEAITAFEAAYVQAANSEQKAALQLHIAQTFQAMGRFKEAEGSYKRAMREAEDGGDELGQAIAAVLLGELLTKLGRLPEAEASLRRAGRYYASKESHWGMLWVYMVGASLSMAKGDLAEALKAHRFALRIVRRWGQRSLAAQILGEIGLVVRRQGRFSSSLRVYRASRKINLEVGRKLDATINLINMCHPLIKLGRHHEAERLARQALDEARAIGAEHLIAAALGNLGGNLVEEQRYTEAESYCEESYGLHRGMGNVEATVIDAMNLGMIFSETDRAADALEYYLEAERLLEQHKSRPELLEACRFHVARLNSRLAAGEWSRTTSGVWVPPRS